ncbi:sigma factor G inhibitor Gin [Metabacillus sp. HB246100]|uniref:sigma factor G inhibitor Gin n=1 Tax=Bacillus weihaiensis TaxID=1547283 RepID=UPI002353D95E|nr:sigma factor G inhibitor Gin [Bacillus weihaiensis]
MYSNSKGLDQQTGETCIICDKKKATGIHLYTSFICVECENDIKNTDTADEKYQFYLNKLRRVKNPPLYS